MILIKTKESDHVIYDWYFISISFLKNHFDLWMDAYTDKAKGITKLEITYDTTQDNTK